MSSNKRVIKCYCVLIVRRLPKSLHVTIGAVTRIVKTAGTDRGSVMKKGGRAMGTRGPDGKNIIKAEGGFTNTAVPRWWWLLATASTHFSGYREVEWVDSCSRILGGGEP